MQARTFLESVRFALAGLWHAVDTERNMRVHCLLAAAALILAWVVGFTPLEWAVLVLTITQVLTAELFNTAVEITVNLITKEYHPLAKAAKNVAAGAVLISSCGALVVGGALFLTRIFSPR